VTNRQPGQPAGAPRAKRFTSAPAAAAATLRDLAGELTGKGMTFQKAWGVVCNRHPAIFKMANRRVVNRRAGDPDVDPADWKEANACEADVLAQLNSEIVQPMDRGTIPTFSGPAGDAISRGTFRRVVQRMMTDDGLTLQQASDKLKQDEPIFWTLAMLALKQDK
jgi:hypothetical protein